MLIVQGEIKNIPYSILLLSFSFFHKKNAIKWKFAAMFIVNQT